MDERTDGRCMGKVKRRFPEHGIGNAGNLRKGRKITGEL